ncbi:MAG: hypothetical protein ACK41Q_12790 [Candidatus Brocadia sp.]
MPRIPRGLVDGFIYHVINRGNGRQKVFHKEQDYEAFINLMEEAKGRHPVKILEGTGKVVAERKQAIALWGYYLAAKGMRSIWIRIHHKTCGKTKEK